MNSDSQLDIIIRLLAETQGADKVQAALDRTKDATGDLTKTTENLGKTTQEGTKHAEKFELSHRAIHQILHLIARESGPAMGGAVAGAAALGTGNVLLMIMAVKELFEWIKKSQEAAAEL